MYLKAMKAAREKLIAKTAGGLIFAGEYSGDRLAYKMGHLACFTGGNLSFKMWSRDLIQ
jgi:hypothetical protein